VIGREELGVTQLSLDWLGKLSWKWPIMCWA